jgi:hypothetical protein
MPIGMPGWPDLACSTASMASARSAFAIRRSFGSRGAGRGGAVATAAGAVVLIAARWFTATARASLRRWARRAPACKYKKSTSRTSRVGRGIPQFGGGSNTNIHPAARRQRAGRMEEARPRMQPRASPVTSMMGLPADCGRSSGVVTRAWVRKPFRVRPQPVVPGPHLSKLSPRCRS